MSVVVMIQVQVNHSCQNHSTCNVSLHSLPRCASKTQRIQVGNGQFVSVLFIIPVIIDVHRHRFDIYTLLSEIHENVDLVLGIEICISVGRISKLMGLLF